MTLLVRLQQWYTRQCDGDWEHSEGVTIQSCDNPGWWVTVNLKGTSLETVAFERIGENVDPDAFHQGEEMEDAVDGARWLDCRVADGVWHGAGDETKLEHILEVFLSWAEGHGS